LNPNAEHTQRQPIMKTQFKLLAISCLLISISFCVLGQGTLTPPGAPAPTMKSLDQVEARTAITNTGAVTISQPGSYYLTRSITVSSGNAVTIATNGVTLDLNGFTVRSTAVSATGYGILLNSGLRNITIANGIIQGSVTNNGSGVYNGGGFNYGIYYVATGPENVFVSRVSVSGCLNYGINLGGGDAIVVESCVVRTVGSSGIVAATVRSSSAVDCGLSGILAEQASECRGQCGVGTGVSAISALHCYGISVSGIGVYGNNTQNCYGTSSNSVGVSAYTAMNCYGIAAGGSGHGVDAQSAQNCYGIANGTGHGINTTTALNCVGYGHDGRGVYALVAQGCYGESSSISGVAAIVVQNCYGKSTSYSGIGLFSGEVAIGCFGENSSSGPGFYGFIANSCHGISTSGTPETVTWKYNMP